MTQGESPAAIVRRVARPRGELTDQQQKRLARLQAVKQKAAEDYADCVVAVLLEGASFAEVSLFTGLSTNTLQRWKREAVLIMGTGSHG